MTESNIFELLQKIYPPNTKTPLKFNEYSRLIPQHVDFISKSLANSIYDSLKENNSVSNSKRVDFIQLIRRWCNRDDNHFSVTEGNYQFLFDSYTPTKKEDALRRILLELEEGQFESLPPDNVLERIKFFYNEQDLKTVEKHKYLDYIADLDRKKLGDPNFFTNKTNIKLDTIESFLSGFLSSSTTPEINEELVENKQEPLKSLKLSRNDRVQVVYSLLNLDKNGSNAKLLERIIEDVSLEMKKTTGEMELAQYLWESKETGHLNLEILQLFPFVYEIPIVNLCMELLNETDDIERFDLIEEFKRNQHKLIEKCRNTSELSFRMFGLINELFILSGYNEDLLDVQKIFDT